MAQATEPEGGAGRAPRRAATAVLLLFVVLAYAYVVVIQPGYGPDERRHFAYVQRLVEKGRLPLAVGGREEDGAHALHPPLYYALAAPVYLATRAVGEGASLRAIKAMSPLLLLGALLMFLAALRRALGDRWFAITAALASVALLPEFLLCASVMNNDALAILLASLLVWLLVRTWGEGPSLRTALAAGVVMALFVNTKAQGWLFAPLWVVALHFRAAEQPGTRRLFLRDMAAGYAVLLLLGSWWYVRSHEVYGQAVMVSLPGDPLQAQFQPRSSRTGEPLSPLEVYTSGEVLPLGGRAAVGLFQSYWAQVDWIAEERRPAVWGAFLALVLLAAAGGSVLVARRLRARGGGEKPPAPWPLALWPLGFALVATNTWYVATFVHLGVYQGGRYLMPAAFGAGAWLALGWEALLPRRLRLLFLALLVGGLVALDLQCIVELVTVLNPRYVR
jgi:4-amino-4-deoxy-L-arabinose transferase-like glycosyltransferase